MGIEWDRPRNGSISLIFFRIHDIKTRLLRIGIAAAKGGHEIPHDCLICNPALREDGDECRNT